MAGISAEPKPILCLEKKSVREKMSKLNSEKFEKLSKCSLNSTQMKIEYNDNLGLEKKVV